jgi:hypothetical protein
MSNFYVTDSTETTPCTVCQKETAHKVRSVIERADDLFNTALKERQAWQCQECQLTWLIEWSADGSGDKNLGPF